MNDHSQHDHDPAEEARLQELLQSLDAGPGTLSDDVMAEIEAETAVAFEQASDTRVETKQGNSRMFTKLAITASGIAIALVLTVTYLPTAGGGPTLHDVLQDALSAKTLTLRVDGDDVWVTDSGKRLRKQTSATRYQIARGRSSWVIDEAKNTVTPQENPWFDEDSQKIDLLALVGASVETRVLREVMSTASSSGGRTYSVKLPAGQSLAAYADRSGRLQRIVIDRGRKSIPLELHVVARDVALDESQFVVAETLSQDGRVAKVVDSQGVVTLRPVGSQRWTPVATHVTLKRGDWLRTDIRGANATKFVTTGRQAVTVGPGSLVEVKSPTQIQLLGGEVNLNVPKNRKPLEVLGAGKAKVVVEPGEQVHLRLDAKRELRRIEQTPKWLAGFDGSSTRESMGSLICNIDDRDVPLTIGVHNVKVEIRDQIARTTIEESFVNHTDGRLEGTFHFPLPQDASISGFGMWINNELVEADVVEKQRAREIYETILRERRDPGLLEWSGGNIFKARVFPILPHSEKRIRIVYTQVLPLRANQYRYSYGLRSEMLQKTPLKELSVNVLVNSELPLKDIRCVNHTARVRKTKSSASIEFAAQEYTPQRDFEVVCEVDSDQADVVVVPHQRGDDGYFMMQLTPPAAAGNWQREVLPDGEQIELVLVCDTSASMDQAKREQQLQFVLATLSALGQDDRFRLAVCDVDCEWFAEDAAVATEATRKRAVDWLDERLSLGWTDLDRMAESVLQTAGKNAHIVYVGDGIVTARDADPHSFANRLQRLAGDRRAGSERKGTFHAVSVGNSFESRVLKALARAGQGAVRQIGGEQTPEKVAYELLNEITHPGLRDIRVEFSGLEIAAVYPRELASLPAGTQQILIGRYNPTGENQQGKVIITGTRNGEPVRFSSQIQLEDAEAGNSFIPRLWARAHLDELLDRGPAPFIKDEVIALSEEFHIMTPYTSLLVLETDEDRERFGVQRRYQMRDGEKFFAKGRDNARFELLQQQMKLAAAWRIQLRRRTLMNLAGLGRDTSLFTNLRNQGYQSHSYSWSGSGGVGLGGGALSLGIAGETMSKAKSVMNELKASSKMELANEESLYDMDGEFPPSESESTEDFQMQQEAQEQLISADEVMADFEGEAPMSMRKQLSDGLELQQVAKGRYSRSRREYGDYNGRGAFMSRYSYDRYIAWVNQLFPSVPAVTYSQSRTDRKPDWSPEVMELVDSLVVSPKLTEVGLEFRVQATNRDPGWQRVTSQTETVQLWSEKQWLHYTLAESSDSHIHWCNEERRGVYSQAYQLGRYRPVHESDLENLSFGQRVYALNSLAKTYYSHKATMEQRDNGQTRLTLSYPNVEEASQVVYFDIDTDKHVIVRIESRQEGKLTSIQRYLDYVEAAGVWWPGKIETLDKTQRITSTTTQTVKSLDLGTFQERFQSELPSPDTAVLLPMTLPTVRNAERAQKSGQADETHAMTLLISACLRQDWKAAKQRMTDFSEAAGDRRGIKWVDLAIAVNARENNKARLAILADVKRLVDEQSTWELFQSQHLRNMLGQIGDYNERLALLNSLQPVYDRHRETAAYYAWRSNVASILRTLGRLIEAFEIQSDLAKQAPWNINHHRLYVSDLDKAGRLNDAITWLRTELQRPQHSSSSKNQLRSLAAEFLRSAGRVEELIQFYEEDWLPDENVDQYTYQRYLHALTLRSKMDDVNATVKKWFAEARQPGKLQPKPLARLNAASAFARGQRTRLYLTSIDVAWLPTLVEAVRFYDDHEHHEDVARTILNDHRFRSTMEWEQLVKEITSTLAAEHESMSARRLSNRIALVKQAGELVTIDWQPIAKSIRQRWEKSSEEDRDAFARSLEQINRGDSNPEVRLDFLRARIARAIADENMAREDQLRNQLFEELLSRTDWSSSREKEAYETIALLSKSGEEVPRRVQQLAALHRFVDEMLKARVERQKRDLQDQERPETLTRTELARKSAEFTKQAREALVQLLDSEQPKFDDQLRTWVELEKNYLQLRLSRQHAEVARACWQALGEEKISLELTDELVSPSDQQQAIIDLHYKERLLTMLTFLSVRKAAPAGLADRLEKIFRAGTELDSDESGAWRQWLFGFLIALDRPDPLEQSLKDWIKQDISPAPWQRRLAYLRAERGDVKAAIGYMETAGKETSLSAADYRALASWHLVNDDRDAYIRSRIDSFLATSESSIRDWLRRKRQPYDQGAPTLPTELDEEVLLGFQALFEKSNNPSSYVSELRRFYTACRDPRLLRMVPDALVGRTPQQIYPFLTKLRTHLLYEVRKEATADEILERLRELRQERQDDLDQRALYLLETLVERQAAEVLNQADVHTNAAVAALKRSFQDSWADGEQRQMAKFLADLGTISQKPLNEERMQQLTSLHAGSAAASDDRVYIAYELARAQFYSANQRADGLRTMEIAVREMRAANDGDWPHHILNPLSGYLNMLQDAKQFAEGEGILLDLLQVSGNESVKTWAATQRDSLYQRAFREGGRVTLGEGRELFVNLEKHLFAQLDAATPARRTNIVYAVLQLYHDAHEKKIDCKANIRNFMDETLPIVLSTTTDNYHRLVRSTADRAREIVGAREALAFLITRVEQYPERYAFTYESAWNRLAYRMATCFEGCRNKLGDLEPRLLKIVCTELRRDLESRNSRSRYFYHDDYGSRYWREKAAKFRSVAEKVLQEKKGSGASVKYLAEYFYHGLNLHDRAIEVLLEAHGRKLLQRSALLRLVDWLHHANRYGESIAILEPLVETQPDVMIYRSRLIVAYQRTARKQQMLALVKDTDEHFRQQGRWTEANIASFAAACLSSKLHAEAAGYYTEAIDVHRRQRTNQVSNGTLSGYYGEQSRAYSAMGETDKAIDAASAAVFVWGKRLDQRKYAVERLEETIKRAKDLSEYVGRRDKEAEKTGVDSPLIRRLLGRVYLNRKDYPAAITQLKIALELQPHDLVAHADLIKAYDGAEQSDLATLQLLSMIETDRHNLELYRDLAKRLREDKLMSERAVTTIVEAAPLEAEHHQALADIRQDQNRWDEAKLHWRHVASLRALEPTGLLGLAEAQVHQKEWDAANETLEKLRKTEWPARFSEVQDRIRKLQAQVSEN